MTPRQKKKAGAAASFQMCIRDRDQGVITEEELQKEEAAIEREIDEAVEYAKAAPLPELSSALEHVFWEG